MTTFSNDIKSHWTRRYAMQNYARALLWDSHFNKTILLNLFKCQCICTKLLIGDTIFTTPSTNDTASSIYSFTRSSEAREGLAACMQCKGSTLVSGLLRVFKTLSIESGIEPASLQLCSQSQSIERGFLRCAIPLEQMYVQQGRLTWGKQQLCTAP